MQNHRLLDSKDARSNVEVSKNSVRILSDLLSECLTTYDDRRDEFNVIVEDDSQKNAYFDALDTFKKQRIVEKWTIANIGDGGRIIINVRIRTKTRWLFEKAPLKHIFEDLDYSLSVLSSRPYETDVLIDVIEMHRLYFAPLGYIAIREAFLRFLEKKGYKASESTWGIVVELEEPEKDEHEEEEQTIDKQTTEKDMKKVYILNQQVMNGTVTMGTYISAFSIKELAEKAKAAVEKANAENVLLKNLNAFKTICDLQECPVYEDESEVPILNANKE